MVAIPGLAALDAFAIEVEWINIKNVKIGPGPYSHKLVQITDIHYNGDRKFISKVVKKINDIAPDFVCFTGDLIDNGTTHLNEILELLSELKNPLYGIPGNHDYWANAPFEDIEKALKSTGGGWLIDRSMVTADGKVQITGTTQIGSNKKNNQKQAKDFTAPGQSDHLNIDIYPEANSSESTDLTPISQTTSSTEKNVLNLGMMNNAQDGSSLFLIRAWSAAMLYYMPS